MCIVLKSIRLGYKVKFIGKCLVWDESTDINDSPFKDFIMKFYKEKTEARKNGNNVKGEISKRSINSLYGKMLQKPCEDNTQIIKNHKEFINMVE